MEDLSQAIGEIDRLWKRSLERFNRPLRFAIATGVPIGLNQSSVDFHVGGLFVDPVSEKLDGLFVVAAAQRFRATFELVGLGRVCRGTPQTQEASQPSEDEPGHVSSH